MEGKELQAILAKRREEHEAKMKELQLIEAQLLMQKRDLKREYRAGNKMLDHLFNKPSEHSILNNRKRIGYILRHKILELMTEFASRKYYDTTQAVCNFNIEDDGTLTFSVTVPLKAEEGDDQA